MLLFPRDLIAHQKKEAVTRVIFNERTGSIEIIHRFSIHDAEHASKKLFGTSTDILGNTFSQKNFADYVRSNFNLKRLSGQVLPLSNVGFEIAGPYLWVYQETALDEDFDGFYIKHGALTEVWPAQTNLVNIERNKEVHSLLFKGSIKEQKISFLSIK